MTEKLSLIGPVHSRKSIMRTVTTIAFAMLLGSTLFAHEAEASSKKSSSCSHYVRHARAKCIAAHHTRHHNKHMVFTRPAPASFIIDADTGKILEAENADSPRYPASLTKMMTLYLTFEALKKNKLELDQTIPVSEHASMQPQTNIALQPGDRLAVKDAILSIVVRSANDAAVTLGEALGGTEEGFARKMTEKARALGMRNTVFFNASGLPEPRQHTTARDMATLGLALRRDFPQYFPFFKTESFSYHGKTYPTHNHVMTRYDGVDGIKTGYIRASGFNLVTSAKRDGHNLVGVVLGGPTWRERDDKMIALLDKNFTQLAANDHRSSTVQVARAEAPANPTLADDEAAEGQGDVTNEADDSSSDDSTSAQGKPVAVNDPVKVDKKQAAKVASNWGIQVGAFNRKSEAVKAATQAMKLAPKALSSSKIAVGDKKVNAHYRARLINLSEGDAKSACSALAAKKHACMYFKN